MLAAPLSGRKELEIKNWKPRLPANQFKDTFSFRAGSSFSEEVHDE